MMKKLEKLKLHNLEEICVKEQRSLRGGTDDAIPPGIIGEVVVYGTAPHSNYYLGTTAYGGSVFDGENGFSSGGGFLANYLYNPDLGPDQIWDAFRGWTGSDVPLDNNSNIQGGGKSAYNGPLLGDITLIPDPRLAAIIKANPSVTLAKVHIRKIADGADAAQNMADAAEGLQVCTSNYSDAKGVMVSLSNCLLIGIETLAKSFTFSISEIAGGDHNAMSTHYLGNSMDVNWVNGIHVSDMTKNEVDAFRDAAFAAGAISVLDPYHGSGHGTHFHIQW